MTTLHSTQKTAPFLLVLGLSLSSALSVAATPGMGSAKKVPPSNVSASPIAASQIKASMQIKAPVRGKGTESEPMILSQARQAFKAGNFKKAMALYSQIPTSSDRWPLAREEMAWTSMRAREFQLAAAQVRSLTNDYLKTQVDLEPFLLQSIVQLYSCDYTAVFNTLKDTKRLMADYVSGVETLAKGQISGEQSSAMEKLASEKSFASLSPQEFHVLPRRFYLDRVAHDAILKGQRQALQSRLIAMAKMDNERNHKILQHLHLVEVEAIQRAFIPNQFGEKKLTQIPEDRNLMIFNGDQELWADEVDKTQADVFMCGSKTGRTL